MCGHVSLCCCHAPMISKALLTVSPHITDLSEAVANLCKIQDSLRQKSVSILSTAATAVRRQAAPQAHRLNFRRAHVCNGYTIPDISSRKPMAKPSAIAVRKPPKTKATVKGAAGEVQLVARAPSTQQGANRLWGLRAETVTTAGGVGTRGPLLGTSSKRAPHDTQDFDR